MTDGQLIALGLTYYEDGYYYITNEITVDVEGNIRVYNDDINNPIWIANVISIEELKVFIECIRR